MFNSIKENKHVKRMMKTPWFSRLRQYFPMKQPNYLDDRDQLDIVEKVLIEWPDNIVKPNIGIVRDYGPYPRWTKYCRLLENNSFPYDFYNLQTQDWIEKAAKFDLIIGIRSTEFSSIEEQKEKYYFLEHFLGKACYPSMKHIFLYEDKRLQTYIAKVSGFPYLNTYISHDKEDALRVIENLNYPVVSKIDPTSGSVGVELVTTIQQARKIVNQAFSSVGRKTHRVHFRQKDYVLFQDYTPNDGYDIRVIVIDNLAFGYYRKVLEGDFRASGMGIYEARALPEKAMHIAREVNKVIKSPMLVVDMLHSHDDQYYIIEYSPICQIDDPAQLLVNDIPGVYVFDDDDTFIFKEGQYWLHELALKEFLLRYYLPNIQCQE